MSQLKSETKEEKRLGNLYGYTGGNYAYQVYSPSGLSPAFLTMTGGGRMPHIVVLLDDNK